MIQTTNWMNTLAQHYEDVRRRATPHERLMIVFDIDATIIDMHHMLLYLVTYLRMRRLVTPTTLTP